MFCFHYKIRHPMRGMSYRSCLGPQFQMITFRECGATIQVKI